MKIYVFVAKIYADNVVNSRSKSSIIIYLHNSMILWNSNKQNTVEVATFVSEFVEMSIFKEIIVAYR